MITITKDIYIENDAAVFTFVGLSSDEKPRGNLNGSQYYEMDTGTTYYYNGETNLWIAKADKYLVDISIDDSFPTEYSVDEAIDPDELIVTASYTDGSTSAVDDFDYMPKDELTEFDTECIVVYEENGIIREKHIPITVTG